MTNLEVIQILVPYPFAVGESAYINALNARDICEQSHCNRKDRAFIGAVADLMKQAYLHPSIVEGGFSATVKEEVRQEFGRLYDSIGESDRVIRPNCIIL